VPHNPVSDPKGDAQAPHYAPVRGPGPNVPSMDLTAAELSQPNADTLRVRMRVANAASLQPPAGSTGIVWLTRWTALSVGDGGETSYRIFYTGARSVSGGDPTFFSGTGTSASPKGIPGNGCVTTTPQNCKIIEYPAEHSEPGSLDRAKGNFVIDGTTATIEGTGFIGGAFGQFRIVLQDLANPGVGKDTFSIELSTGVKISGTITSGEIAIS